MLLLFDIDGTLLLSGGAGRRALNRAFRERYGVDDGMNGVSPAGKTDPFIVREMFRARLEREPSDTEVAELLDAYVPVLEEELAAPSLAFELMPRVEDTLDRLAEDERYLLGIATGNIRAAAEAKLDRGGLRDRFRFGGYACDHHDRAEIVATARSRGEEALGRPAPDEEVFVIGDTVRDIAAARACGIRAIAVVTGPSSDYDELRAASPDALLDDLSGLLPFLRRGR